MHALLHVLLESLLVRSAPVAVTTFATVSCISCSLGYVTLFRSGSPALLHLQIYQVQYTLLLRSRKGQHYEKQKYECQPLVICETCESLNLVTLLPPDTLSHYNLGKSHMK